MAIKQELRKAAREIATGAHLSDRFCESLDLDKNFDKSAALDVGHEYFMVKEGYSRLWHACPTLDSLGISNPAKF